MRHPKIEIIKARQDDLAKIARLQAISWRSAYRGMLSKEYLDSMVEEDLRLYWGRVVVGQDDLILKAEDDQQELVGFITVWGRPIPFVDNLHVLPKFYGQGVGARLMAAAARELLAGGRNSAELWAFEENKRALRFYEKLGGVRNDRAIKPVCGHDVVQVQYIWNDLKLLRERARGCYTNVLI